MTTTNDEMLNLLYRWAGETLDFRPIVEVVDGLRGGFWNQRADGAAAYNEKGVPVVALDSDYRRWPQDHLVYVVAHEIAHHRLGHVHKAARSVPYTPPAPRTQQHVDYTKRIETQADQVARSYVKSFNAWRFKQLEIEVRKLRDVVLWQQRQEQLAARSPQPKTVQPKFRR